MFAREERERKDCQRVSVSVSISNSYTFVCFVSVSKRQKRGRRVEEASDMQA